MVHTAVFAHSSIKDYVPADPKGLELGVCVVVCICIRESVFSICSVNVDEIEWLVDRTVNMVELKGWPARKKQQHTMLFTNLMSYQYLKCNCIFED